MNLYAINSQLMAVLDTVDPETGDITAEAFEALEALEIAQEEKVLGLGKWIKNLTAESDALAVEIKNLQARKKSADNRAERLKKYLADTVAGKQFKDAQCVISWRKSQSIEVLDIDALPETMVRIKVERAADKTAIKQAIEAGAEVIGARLIEALNPQIK